MNRQTLTTNILNIMVAMLVSFAFVWFFIPMPALPHHAIASLACVLDMATYLVYWANGDWSLQGVNTSLFYFKQSRMTMSMGALACWEIFLMLLPSPQDDPELVFSLFFWTQVGLVSGLFLCFIAMIVVVTFVKPNGTYKTTTQ